MKHVIITREKLPLLQSLSKKAGVSLERKEVFIQEVKFIVPESFNPRLWSRNWMHVYDILLNGDIYGEILVLVVDEISDLKKLYEEQRKLVSRRSVIIS